LFKTRRFGDWILAPSGGTCAIYNALGIFSVKRQYKTISEIIDVDIKLYNFKHKLLVNYARRIS
jgi:hypothetical protein